MKRRNFLKTATQGAVFSLVGSLCSRANSYSMNIDDLVAGLKKEISRNQFALGPRQQDVDYTLTSTRELADSAVIVANLDEADGASVKFKSLVDILSGYAGSFGTWFVDGNTGSFLDSEPVRIFYRDRGIRLLDAVRSSGVSYFGIDRKDLLTSELEIRKLEEDVITNGAAAMGDMPFHVKTEYGDYPHKNSYKYPQNAFLAFAREKKKERLAYGANMLLRKLEKGRETGAANNVVAVYLPKGDTIEVFENALNSRNIPVVTVRNY